MMDLKGGGGGGVLVYCISKVLTYLILHQIRYPQLLIKLALRFFPLIMSIGEVV